MSEAISEGRILKSIGGFYTVEASDGIYNCKARGIFRLHDISPCAGDFVKFQLSENAEPLIVEVLPRKNYIIRPPLANLDEALIVVSTCEPSPNAFILDKLIAIFDGKGIEPLLVFTKKDLLLCEDFISVYKSVGFRCMTVDSLGGDGIDEIKRELQGKVTALIGNSGVGKSSLLNAIAPELSLDTSIISKKLGRGKHTTRQVELYKMDFGGYIADTPGFSTVDTGRYITIPSAEVRDCFREFREYSDDCRFDDCRHLKEKGCAVTEALKNGKIAQSRYDSYARMVEEAKTAENTY